MTDTETISSWKGGSGSLLKADCHSSNTGAATEIIEQVRARLAKADDRIAALQSELRKKHLSVRSLFSDDFPTEEVAKIKELVWTFHRGLPGGCQCNLCGEVERSRREIEGLL